MFEVNVKNMTEEEEEGEGEEEDHLGFGALIQLFLLLCSRILRPRVHDII